MITAIFSFCCLPLFAGFYIAGIVIKCIVGIIGAVTATPDNPEITIRQSPPVFFIGCRFGNEYKNIPNHEHGHMELPDYLSE